MNTYTGNAYSLLSDLDEASREALANFGLSWRHSMKTQDGMIYVKCLIEHEHGHSEETILYAAADSLVAKQTNALQSIGGVTTYLKRMTLSAMLGLVSDDEFDDDGNFAGKDGGAPKQSRAPKAKGGALTVGQAAKVREVLGAKGKNENDLCAAFKLNRLEDMQQSVMPSAIKWISQS